MLLPDPAPTAPASDAMPDECVRFVDRALSIYVAEGADADALDATRPTLRSACVSARRAGLRAEAVVVLLKERWHAESRAGASERRRGEALERIVSGAIGEFYADAS
jgi:hypothetical protein